MQGPQGVLSQDGDTGSNPAGTTALSSEEAPAQAFSTRSDHRSDHERSELFLAPRSPIRS